MKWIPTERVGLKKKILLFRKLMLFSFTTIISTINALVTTNNTIVSNSTTSSGVTNQTVSVKPTDGQCFDTNYVKETFEQSSVFYLTPNMQSNYELECGLGYCFNFTQSINAVYMGTCSNCTSIQFFPNNQTRPVLELYPTFFGFFHQTCDEMMNRDFGSFIQISSHSPAIVENLVIQKFSPWTPDISPSNGPDIVNPIDTRTPSDPDVKPISFNPSGADEPDNSRSAGIDQTVPVPSGEQITSVGSNGQSGPISNNDPTIAMNQQAQTSQDAASASGNPIPVDNQSTASSDAVSSGITLPANNGVNSTNQAAAVSNNSGTACQMSLILLCCHLFYIIL